MPSITQLGGIELHLILEAGTLSDYAKFGGKENTLNKILRVKILILSTIFYPLWLYILLLETMT